MSKRAKTSAKAAKNLDKKFLGNFVRIFVYILDVVLIFGMNTILIACNVNKSQMLGYYFTIFFSKKLNLELTVFNSGKNCRP